MGGAVLGDTTRGSAFARTLKTDLEAPTPMTAGGNRPDIEAFRLMRYGRYAEALVFARRAVAGARECLPAHGLLATVLMNLGRPADAEEAVLAALEHDHGSPDSYDALAFVSLQLGQHERSNLLYRRAAALAPATARFQYNLASSERSFGRLIEAEAACDRAISLDSGHYPSYLLRSELRVQSDGSNHVDELTRRLSAASADDRTQLFLGYALAKELDDLQRFDEAFHWFSTAAAARLRHLAYDVSVDERKIQRIIEAFPRQGPPRRTSAAPSANYVFIVGLPRSGTTLVERILTGLPAVRSNGETENFSRALLAAAPAKGADVFERAAAADPERVAAMYSSLAGGTAGESIVEKLPLNYLYLGAIRRAMPDARILVVQRAPIDSCFAMYRTLFGEAYPFSYGFEDLARYFAAYSRLMSHWRSMFGTGLTEVSYEDLVKDPANVGAGTAGACGLTWVRSAVEMEKNASVSLTASASQIRRPIYGTSSGRWRHYRRHLSPLIEGLRRLDIVVPEDA